MIRITKLVQSPKFRYLLAGGWNTFFGYGLMVVIYDQYKEQAHILLLGAICNVISITMSFVTYKLFVFRTHGDWIGEWMRSFVVYGGAALLSMTLLWVLVDFIQMNIFFAQALAIVIVVTASYIGHAAYTFNKSKGNRL